MKPINFLFALTFFFFSQVASSQKFIDPANEWYLSDCSISFTTGEISCVTYWYKFGDIVSIDDIEYYELKSNRYSLNFYCGKYYREEEDKVYLKYDIGYPEYLIYDFNVNIGDELEIGDLFWSTHVEITSIDSIQLISGDMRKRVGVNLFGYETVKTYWIEGVGSLSSPMDTREMFSLDSWNSLNCFQQNGNIEFQLGDCLLTSVDDEIHTIENIKLYPNPTSNNLSFETNRKVAKISIVDLTGRILMEFNDIKSNRIDIRNLDNGVYFSVFEFPDGSRRLIKFYKQ